MIHLIQILYLNVASAILVEKAKNGLDLLFSLSHIQRFLDQPHEGLEVHTVITLSLNLITVQNALEYLVEQCVLRPNANGFQVVEELIERDLLVLRVHVPIECVF